MKSGYWFSEEDCVAKVTALLSACYERPYDRKYVEWMGRVGSWFVARCGDEDIGVYGVLPLIYKTGGVLIDVGLVNNVGVVRRHRGGSLFDDLGRYAMARFGMSAYLGVSNSLALKGHLRAGWSHSHDVGLVEGAVPSGGFDSWCPEDWGARHVRGHRWREWRYSKPGECYKVNDGVVYKVFDGAVQIVESGEFTRAGVFGVGMRIGLMTTAGGSTWSRLIAVGFKEQFRRHVVVRGLLTECLLPRVEPCDYDTF